MKTGFLHTLFLILITISAHPIFGQTAKVRGTVTGAGQPLIGASVVAANRGSITNDQGQFELEVPAGDRKVVVSSVGFQTLEQQISLNSGETQTLDFELQPNSALSEVVVLGSRSQPRTQLSSPVPVDVIDVSQLSKFGAQVSIDQILNYAAPSFTSNSQSIADGADHVNPASLRGMSPDEVLVLINGKRRHTSSLINIVEGFGMGSVSTDLNAIPVAAIDRIEVLRDGASAQYGSDAIAGVINIVLKQATNKLDASFTMGQHNTKTPVQHYHDGDRIQLSLNYVLPIGKNGGFVNFTGSYDHRNPTNRTAEITPEALENMPTIYGFPEIPLYTNPAGENRSDSFMNATHTTMRDYSWVLGQSKYTSGQFFYNAAIPVSSHAEFYSFGGFGYRKGLSKGLPRYPQDPFARNVSSIYLTGFTPEIGSDIYDKSVATGIRGEANGWHIDFSNTFGQNEFLFSALNSLNASMQDKSPISFRAGGPKFIQNTVNLDASRSYDWLAGVDVALGTEYRFERYQLNPGEEASYANYGTATEVGVDGMGNPILIPDINGTVSTLFGGFMNFLAVPGGAQGFPGFRPENQVDKTRSAVSGYGDVAVNFTDQFLADGAIRYENYSDFGNTVNGKLALRYKVTNKINVRVSGSTGFRAPSLQQRYFASTATIFPDGKLIETGIFPNDSRAAKLLGIPSLKPEKSNSISGGITGDFGAFKFTIDGYFTRINDRIVFTDLFEGNNDPSASDADRELYAILQSVNASNAQFFMNAVNTNTRGVDFVFTYSKPLGGGFFRADLAGTISATDQVGAIKTPEVLREKADIVFSERNRVYLENSIPSVKGNLSLNYQVRKWNIFFRNNYFGGVTDPSDDKSLQQFFRPKVVTDLSVSYKLVPEVGLTIGSNNLFDIYPDRLNTGNDAFGQVLYSRSAMQYGFNGRFIFARLDVTL